MTHFLKLKILLLILIALACLSVRAQDNPYKINDSLYELYNKGYKNMKTAKGLLYADSLYNRAVLLGDTKAQCLGKVLAMRHYNSKNNQADVMRGSAETRRVAKENGYMQYYYYAYHSEMIWHLNHNLSVKAWQLANEMKKEAFQDNNPYGIYYSLRGMGDVFYTRRSLSTSIHYYKEAINFVVKNLPDQSPSNLYQTLSNCFVHRYVHNVDSALFYIDKAIATAKELASLRSSMEMKTYLLLKAKRVEEAKVLFEKTKKLYEKMGRGKNYYRIMSLRAINEKDFNKAFLYADSIGHDQDKLARIQSIYEELGNYKEALKVSIMRTVYADSVIQSLQTQDIAEFEAQLKVDNLKRENIELDLANSNLLAKQLEQQLNIAQINADKQLLELELQKGEAERQRAKVERLAYKSRIQKMSAEKKIMLHKQQAERLKLQQKVDKQRSQILAGCLVLVLMCIAFLIYRYLGKKRQVEKLHKINTELDEARKKAEQADKIKTLFVQNMSHEIRTPLNVIVGFSQLLSEPDIPLEDEEKREMGKQILANTEMLTTLINDILNISELEMGTYVMTIEDMNCNETCRSALSMVQHRCPQGVKMYFTSDVADDVVVRSDTIRVKQVLVNFLTNATKFTEKGEIRLHASEKENKGFITFSVTDTGKGVPAEKAEEIFERFKKLDMFKQGNGIGLNLCRLISEQLKGKVMLDTSYTGGARFLFLLPDNRI